MKNIAVFVNEKKDSDYLLTKDILNYLNDFGCIFYSEKKLADLFKNNFKIYELNSVTERTCDYAIVIGGDGTILNAIAELGNTNIPLLGINLGRIGFLADVAPDDFKDKLQKILNRQFTIDERMTVSLHGEKLLYGNALNEVMFRQKQGNGVGKFKVFVDGKQLANYSADGVLIAAPTGSTAYSLSAGGPIINPACDVIIIQPIAPHSLNNRSIVISTKEKVVVEFDNSQSCVYLDGIRVQTEENRLKIEKSKKVVKFIRFEGYNFYDILFDKLN